MNITAYEHLFQDMIASAQVCEASDVHIEPERSEIKIRFRVDGELRLWKQLTGDHRQALTFEIKRQTGLSIATHGRDQDGRASLPELQLDLRASLIPTQFGEKIVLRLLSHTRSFRLTDQGYSEQTIADLRAALALENGLILISGATGSGKTTTLYSLLSELDSKKENILTIEDPVEYTFAGITQVPVTSRLSFAQALRAALRQDPDVILVGEVRDAETADLCLKAAATGHLVLSTIHANGAAEVLHRLKSLNADPDLVRSCLKFSGAQRLVKRLCRHCARPLAAAELHDLWRRMGSDASRMNRDFERARMADPAGCTRCAGGTRGRAPILEYLCGTELWDCLHARCTPDSSDSGTPPSIAKTFNDACLDQIEAGRVAADTKI